MNTETAEYTTTGINHVEGGWPKDVDHAEIEQVGSPPPPQLLRLVRREAPLRQSILTQFLCLVVQVSRYRKKEEKKESFAETVKEMGEVGLVLSSTTPFFAFPNCLLHPEKTIAPHA